MINIKQKFLKLIISFICLFSISSCDLTKDLSYKKASSKNIVDISILLPLSGEDGVLGTEYNKMIKLGLSDATKTHVRVTSYDSTTESALQNSLDKIFEQGTDIIIGPLYSETTKKVADKARGKEVTIFSLSNNPVLAEKQVFVFGHAPMRQLVQTTNYLLDNEYKNYIILLPTGHHSQTVSKILQDMITSKGATLAKLEFYNNLPEDISKSVKIVSDIVDNLNEMDENLTQPVILIADDAETLQHLFANIAKYNLDKKAVIAGDNRINIDFPQPINIMYTGSPHILSTNIKERAQKIGINHISFMHALAYDAGKMVASSIGHDYNKNKFLHQMNSPAPFTGISGNIRFIDSIAQREYSIISKKNGKYDLAKVR